MPAKGKRSRKLNRRSSTAARSRPRLVVNADGINKNHRPWVLLRLDNLVLQWTGTIKLPAETGV